jgi:hypothetical protein
MVMRDIVEKDLAYKLMYQLLLRPSEKEYPTYPAQQGTIDGGNSTSNI